MAIIEVEHLTRFYNSHPAVDAISFDIDQGTIVGLIGPNGAGKSTTFKMLTTLLPPTSGTARIVGYDLVEQAGRIREVIGYVPQLVSADGELTGYENLLLSSNLYGIPYAQAKAQIAEVVEFMGIGGYQNQLARNYSGGMVRRLEIAQALVHRPEVLFLDEPSIGLDPAARKALWQHIHSWQKEARTTVMITTHDMEAADVLCERILFIVQGKLIASGTPAELKSRLGPDATLDDVYVHYTGTSHDEGGTLRDARHVRRQYR